MNHQIKQTIRHSVLALVWSAALSTSVAYTLTDRPAEVQQAVDKAFEANKNAGRADWLYNGDWGSYGLLGLDDETLLKNLALTKEKDIYILDVGCSRGAWGRRALETLLQDKACKKK